MFEIWFAHLILRQKSIWILRLIEYSSIFLKLMGSRYHCRDRRYLLLWLSHYLLRSNFGGSSAHNCMCFCATEVGVSHRPPWGSHQSHSPWFISVGRTSLYLVQESTGSQKSLHLLNFLQCQSCNVYRFHSVGKVQLCLLEPLCINLYSSRACVV